jgi:hypothetical protein
MQALQVLHRRALRLIGCEAANVQGMAVEVED